MGYIADTATTMDEIKTAIEAESVANGWTLEDGILFKSGCYFQLASRNSASSYLAVYGGTGKSGSTLLDQAPQGAAIVSNSGGTFTFPINYEIHSFDDTDEIYCIINYDTSFCQILAFGHSDLDNIGGTGAWITGTIPANKAVSSQFSGFVLFSVTQHSLGTNSYLNNVGTPLFTGRDPSFNQSSFIHSGLDSTGWSQESGSGVGNLLGISYCASLLTSLPNLSNQSSPLLPIKAIKRRNSSGLTVIANLSHARYIRNDNVDLFEVITIGSEKWKCYPLFRKDSSLRNGTSTTPGVTHSGTFGYAIRYQGP